MLKLQFKSFMTLEKRDIIQMMLFSKLFFIHTEDYNHDDLKLT